MKTRDFKIEKVVTRKERKCKGCQKKIPSGTAVECRTIVRNKKMKSVYLCDDCSRWIDSHHENDWITAIIESNRQKTVSLYTNGMSVNDIAEKLDITVNMVYARLNYSRKIV